MEKADMHVHTTASDGVHTPAQIVDMACHAGLQAVAITDHDTLGGIPDALAAGSKSGLAIIPGVEISTQLDGQDIHMLGYYLDYEDERLRSRLDSLRNAREERNAKIIEKLNEHGIDITLSEVWNTVNKNADQGLTIGRPHIAEALVRKGVARSISDAFDQYLAAGAKAYVNPTRITPQDAVDWIHDAGGSVVIAHPGLYQRDDLVERILACGVDGIEAYHSDHTPEQERHYASMAGQAGLIATAGSDFHGERMGELRHSYIGARTMDVRLLSKLKRGRAH